MSRLSGTFTLADLSNLFYDDKPNQTLAYLSNLLYDENPNQTQEISHVGEQNFDKEMGKSSHTKQKKLRSDVWKMFEKCKDKDGKDLAKCSLCEKWFDGSSKKGTTHLRNHFKSCQNKRNEGGASGSGDKPAGNSVTDQQLDHLEGVKRLIKQSYWVSPKQVGDDDIIKVYDEEKEKLRMYFKKLSCRFSLTITNMADGKFTGFVVRFINDDWKLKEKIIGLKCIEGDQNMKVLKNVLSDLGIDNKISSMVTDERENRFSGQGSLVKIALGLKEAFFELENIDSNFKSINLTKEQWEVITTLYQFWNEGGFVETWSELKCGTANMHFHVLCRMYNKSLALETLDPFISGERYLQFARDAKKCWDQSNLILAVAAALDPRFKVDIVEHWYKKIYGDEWKKQLETFLDYLISVYNEYAIGTNNIQSSTSGSKEKKSSISYEMLDILGYPSRDSDGELHQYLKDVDFPLRKDFDILEWWRFYSRYFPTLAKMARDFLSIQIIAHTDYMYSGFLFSLKNFNSDIVKEAFVCTKNWLIN